MSKMIPPMDSLVTCMSGLSIQPQPHTQSVGTDLFGDFPFEIQLRIIDKLLKGRRALDSLMNLMQVLPHLQKYTVVMNDLSEEQLSLEKVHPVFALEGFTFMNIATKGALGHCSKNFPIRICLFYNHDYQIPQSLAQNLPLYHKAMDIATLFVIRNRGYCAMASEFINKSITQNPSTPVRYFWHLPFRHPHVFDAYFSVRDPNPDQLTPDATGKTIEVRGFRPPGMTRCDDWWFSKCCNAKDLIWRVPTRCKHKEYQRIEECMTPRLRISLSMRQTDKIMIFYNGGRVPMLNVVDYTWNNDTNMKRSFTLFNQQYDPETPCGRPNMCSFEPENDEAHSSVDLTLAEREWQAVGPWYFTFFCQTLEYTGVPDQILDLTQWSNTESFKWKRLCPTPGSTPLRANTTPIEAPVMKSMSISSVILHTDTNPPPIIRVPQLEKFTLEALPGSDTHCDPSKVINGASEVKKVTLIGAGRTLSDNTFLPLPISCLSSISASLLQLTIARYQIDFQSLQHSAVISFPKLQTLTVDIASFAYSGFFEGQPLRELVIKHRTFPHLQTLLLDSSEGPLRSKIPVSIVRANEETFAIRDMPNTEGLEILVIHVDEQY